MTTPSTKHWLRNTEGLRSHAQKKTESTRLRAEAALALLIRENRPINFKSVAEAAGISTAWLYGDQTLKERIISLREQQVPSAQVRIPPREQASNASKDTMIAALRKRVKDLEAENRTLKQQVEIAYGLVIQ